MSFRTRKDSTVTAPTVAPLIRIHVIPKDEKELKATLRASGVPRPGDHIWIGGKHALVRYVAWREGPVGRNSDTRALVPTVHLDRYINLRETGIEVAA